MPEPIHAPETLTTERLLLRRPTTTDAGPLYETYVTDPDVVTYLMWRPHENRDETIAFLQLCLEKWRHTNERPYVIERLDDPGKPVGMIDMRCQGSFVGLGYVLARAQWGQGLMPEAMRAIIDWCLAQPAIFRVEAFCDVDNTASARVMEKAGMSFEGVLRRYNVHPNISDEPRDCRMYAAVRE